MSEHLTNIVVCACIARDGKIFMARRANTKTTFAGEYELVGGHADPGEQPEAALQREIQEELGVDINVIEPVFAFTYHSEGVDKIEIVYLCTLNDPTNEPILNPADHSQSCWVGPDGLDRLGKDDIEITALQKAFKALERTIT